MRRRRKRRGGVKDRKQCVREVVSCVMVTQHTWYHGALHLALDGLVHLATHCGGERLSELLRKALLPPTIRALLVLQQLLKLLVWNKVKESPFVKQPITIKRAHVQVLTQKIHENDNSKFCA